MSHLNTFKELPRSGGKTGRRGREIRGEGQREREREREADRQTDRERRREEEWLSITSSVLMGPQPTIYTYLPPPAPRGYIFMPGRRRRWEAPSAYWRRVKALMAFAV